MDNKNFMERSRTRKERMILLIYSLYTVAMVFVSFLCGWGSWILPVILAGMAYAWAIHIRLYRSYRFRAFAVSLLALMNFTIYGTFSEDLFGTLSTLVALVILLGIYGIPEIIYFAAGASALLIFIHAFILQTIHPSSVYEGTRMLLQFGSVVTAECVTYYLVKSQIEINEELVNTIDILKKAEQSKDDFMANVSHEIRTPVNTVCGMSEMVLREDLPDEIREYAFDIQAAGRNLLSVVSDILDFSELESGNVELVEEPYNITSTINDVMNIALAQMNGRKLELIVDCDASIPRSLLGDEQKLRRAIMNIVGNAIKFTREGCVIIEFSARKETYGVNLCVKVKDTGIGMQEEDLEKLFTSFNQVDTKKNRQEGGIGLGLAISQAIINKMGGFISVSSEYQKGSEVQFVVPQKVLDEKPIVSIREPYKIFAAGYFDMEKYSLAAVREGYVNSIANMTAQLGITYRQCRNLAELKRRIEKNRYTHLFIGWEEYSEDEQYFERLADEMRVIVILDRENAPSLGGKILKVYKPFYVLSVAAVLNGDNVVQSMDGGPRMEGRFLAPKASVLVVDDNMMNLKVVEGLLRPYKIKVFTATSGKEALKKIETMDYDFVFMDHMMPEMDGVETLHRIRQKPGNYFQNVPIIVLTANAIGGVREMFLAEGFQDFVAKPIELSVLERVLRRFIPENKIQRAEECAAEEAGANRAGGASEAGESKEQEAVSASGRHRPQLEGIDIDQGIAYCGGSLEDYCEILQVYYETGKNKIKEIASAYASEDWKSFTILVHAVKSTSLGIGAGALSEMAKKLEEAGKEANAVYIRENYEAMFKEYERTLQEIGTKLDIDVSGNCPDGAEQETLSGQEALPELETEELWEYLKRLNEKLETFESMGVEQVLGELAAYQYRGERLEELLAEVWAKVREFDFLGAGDVLAGIQEKMR